MTQRRHVAPSAAPSVRRDTTGPQGKPGAAPAHAAPTAGPRGGLSIGSPVRMVERAISDLRRGDLVLVRPDSGPALLIQAAEAASESSLARFAALAGAAPAVALTAQRAVALGLQNDAAGVVWIEPGDALDAPLLRALSDPTQEVSADRIDSLARRLIPPGDPDGANAAVALSKLARLLPAVLAAPVDRPLGVERLLGRTDLLSVAAHDIDAYPRLTAQGLVRTAGARVPLADAETTEIIAFRPQDGGQEHLALVIGTVDPTAPVRIRLHSECFTGDLLGSMRCDCGDQLRGAIATLAELGGGVLLYLAQEGRGIGLVNKLRAYQLQDAAFDTVDANEMLGYDADERVYQPAAEMLRQLGIAEVRLLTNNPDKVAQLEAYGIQVVERIPHRFPANGHNEFYLRTKKLRSGHDL